MSLPELTKDNFQSEVLDKNGVILVDFGATWCPPCKMLKPILEELHEEGFSISYVDIDDSPDLASQYAVTAVPTMIFFKNGEEKKRMLGMEPKNKIKKFLERL
jgi:thioredoxin 1